MTTHRILGYTIGIAWAIGCLWAGVFLIEVLAQEFGDTFGASLPLFVLLWLGVLFTGRSLLEALFSAAIGRQTLVLDSSASIDVDRFTEQVWDKAFALGLAVTIIPVALTVQLPTNLHPVDPDTKTFSEATFDFSSALEEAA